MLTSFRSIGIELVTIARFLGDKDFKSDFYF